MDQKNNKKLIVITVLLTALITVSIIFAGLKFTGLNLNQGNGTTTEQAVDDDTGSKERKVAYWQAPMNPTELYDAPGKSLMGMDLVPVYEDELAGDSE
ncbi:MAG: efflux RND transporter periplasmic adaptor subunit, partial [Desulfobacula sp.]|nr:efflux RND transporter periplasmic adaptor subunit [Desulfobacula sp.]